MYGYDMESFERLITYVVCNWYIEWICVGIDTFLFLSVKTYVNSFNINVQFDV